MNWNAIKTNMALKTTCELWPHGLIDNRIPAGTAVTALTAPLSQERDAFLVKVDSSDLEFHCLPRYVDPR